MGAHEPNPLREARTGLITLATVLGATALSIVLATVEWRKQPTYRVGFRVTQDATNIAPGTPVVLGGLVWGKVTRVQHAEFRATGSIEDAVRAVKAKASRGTLVEFELDPRIQLEPGASISRSATFLGSNVALVINDTGGMRGGRSMPSMRGSGIDQGLVLAAQDPADASTTLLGLRAARNLQALPDLYEELQRIWKDLYTGKTMTAFEALKGNGMALRDAFQQDQPRWEGALDRTSRAMDSLRARFGPGSADMPGLESDINQTRDRSIAAWDGLSADAESLKSRFNTEAEPRARALWRRAQDEWTRTTMTIDRLKAAGGESADAFYDYMANSSLMGGQISRAIGTPLLAALQAVLGVGVAMVDTDMITRLERYDAASQLVIATDDLRLANDALLALSNGANPGTPEMSKDLREQAVRAVTAFRTAVERLVDLSQRP